MKNGMFEMRGYHFFKKLFDYTVSVKYNQATQHTQSALEPQ